MPSTDRILGPRTAHSAQFWAGDLIGVDYGKYPAVKRWVDSMQSLPKWKEVNQVHDGFAASLKDKPFVSIR
jgi:glutathione S-transferase